MKILLITDTHDPQKGGAEKYFFKLKKNLQAKPGIDVFSLGFGPKKIIGKDFVVLPETSFKAFRQLWRMFFNPLKYLALRHWIRKVKPDIIHLHNINKYTISLLKAVKDFPLVQSTHDFSFVCPTQWNVHQNLKPCLSGFHRICWREHKRNINFFAYSLMLMSFFRKRNYLKKYVKNYISPSFSLKNYLQQQGFDEVALVPLFVQKKTHIEFDSMKARHFLFIGQLEKQKGVDLLIEEFALAQHKNKNLILKIVGRGSEKQALIQKINELQLQKNILLFDWVDDPSAFYNECSAVIFPSIGLESFGLVMTEAMSFGRAVIGSKRGPTMELIEEGQTGLLFDPLQKGQLAEKILLLAENTSLTHQYGRAAWEKLQSFWTDDKIVEEILKVYRQCYTAC